MKMWKRERIQFIEIDGYIMNKYLLMFTDLCVQQDIILGTYYSLKGQCLETLLINFSRLMGVMWAR